MPPGASAGVRLRFRREFVAVQEHGRRVSGRYLTLLALPNMLPCDRLGIIASRRLGGAIVRNRAKRRIRELFRRRPQGLAQGAGTLDLVAIPRRELVDAPFPSLQSEFARAIDKLRAVKPS